VTQEEIMKKGLAAAQLLNNEDFIEFFKVERELLLAAIGNTQPHEVKTRESLFYQQYALNSFLQGLNQYISAAEEVVKALDSNKEESD
jgi:flagellar biosynthesis chaperone FliJ